MIDGLAGHEHLCCFTWAETTGSVILGSSNIHLSYFLHMNARDMLLRLQTGEASSTHLPSHPLRQQTSETATVQTPSMLTHSKIPKMST